jgi:hypothetical protein
MDVGRHGRDALGVLAIPFERGARVRVLAGFVAWATGTVVEPHVVWKSGSGFPTEEDYSGHHFRTVQTLQGPEREYWVEFDERQRDLDGDGPYASAAILESDLRRIRH